MRVSYWNKKLKLFSNKDTMCRWAYGQNIFIILFLEQLTSLNIEFWPFIEYSNGKFVHTTPPSKTAWFRKIFLRYMWKGKCVRIWPEKSNFDIVGAVFNLHVLEFWPNVWTPNPLRTLFIYFLFYLADTYLLSINNSYICIFLFHIDD